MKKKIPLVIAASCLLCLITFAQEVLTNKSIVSLIKAGLSKDIILSKIELSPCKFDVTTNGLIDLKKQGVGDDLVKAMIDKSNVKPVSNGNGPSAPKPDKHEAGLSNVELMNHVYVYNKNNQSVKPLDKSVASLRTKQGMFGGSVMLHLDREKSAMRLSPDDAGNFVINTGSAAAPELTLYKLKSAKGKREVVSMKANSFSGMKTGDDVIPINISKLKDGIYQIAPSRRLEKAEYFFVGKAVAGANSMDSFAFGVD